MRILTISLHQPWASLVAFREKWIETRHWRTSHRGLLAIHAAKREPVVLGGEFQRALERAGHRTCYAEHPRRTPFLEPALPGGAIVAIVDLVDCVPTVDCLIDGDSQATGQWHRAEGKVVSSYRERILGDYTIGRFAWLLDNIRPLPDPIPTRSRQRLWWWSPPAEFEVPV